MIPKELYPIGTTIVIQDRHQAQFCSDFLEEKLESWSDITKNWSKGFNPLNYKWQVIVDEENQIALSKIPFMLNEKIRCIRQGLCLNRAEASRVLGGGPKSFLRYEEKNIKPSKSTLVLLQLIWDYRASKDFYEVLYRVCHYTSDAIWIHERITDNLNLDFDSQEYKEFSYFFNQSFNLFCENSIKKVDL